MFFQFYNYSHCSALIKKPAIKHNRLYKFKLYKISKIKVVRLQLQEHQHQIFLRKQDEVLLRNLHGKSFLLQDF